MELLKIVSSQFKLRPTTTLEEIDVRTIKSATCLKNEPFSFQVLYRAASKNPMWEQVSISVKCDLPVQVYRVDWTAVSNAVNIHNEKGFEGSEPGLYPNPLMPRSAMPKIEPIINSGYGEPSEKHHLNADNTFRALWVTLNPQSVTVDGGTYKVEITLTSLLNADVSEQAFFEIEVINVALPKQKIMYTNWFHVDCLCDYYNVEPYTDEFYGYFESFIRNAAMHRQNVLLTPAFTPELDTPIGSARRNVQLVDVTVEESGYKFGFERLLKFLETADKCGITYFEHCHLFSQWGANSAITVYDVNGNVIFDCRVPAAGDKYRDFLNAYLDELFKFANKHGYGKRFIFHISDEPTAQNIESYRAAVNTVKDALCGKTVIDALTDIEYHRLGLVQTPVVLISNAEQYSAECDNFWLYYTGAPFAKYANRLITCTAARERVLGLQLYYYGAKGFLHWGYNYYYNTMSTGIFDPLSNPCGYKNIPGATFLAYPIHDGAVPSICEKLMLEAMDDIRALELLESFIGKKDVVALCEQFLGEKISNTLIPEKEDMFLLRQKINDEIKNHTRMTKYI